MFKFGNGQPVRGSGIGGIVIGRADYANGTRKYLVREDATPASFDAPEPPIS